MNEVNQNQAKEFPELDRLIELFGDYLGLKMWRDKIWIRDAEITHAIITRYEFLPPHTVVPARLIDKCGEFEGVRRYRAGEDCEESSDGPKTSEVLQDCPPQDRSEPS